MKNKRWLILLIVGFLLIPFNVLVPDADAAGDWVIDGDTVYIDDENLYISATPHTLDSDGWVEFELETKTYDGDIDVVWGFDIPSCTPHHPQIWMNYTHELVGYHYVERVGSIEIFNVTGWVNLGIENYDLYIVDYGNSNNTYLMNISYESNLSLIVAFNSYVEFGDGDDYRLTGHYDNYESYFYYETFFDWKQWNTSFNIVSYIYGGMNTWYLLEGVSVVHGYRYRVRAWIDIPFNTVGKYWWAMKPSDKSIPEAIADGSFYSLDPWWDSDFSYYKMITVESGYIDNSLDNFPVLVNSTNATLIAKCDGGDSVRFLSLDNTTEFAYEIEEWNVGGFSIWVNISETLTSGSDYSFLMYYGNAGASDNQNPTGVWDGDYLAVWHMNSLLDSTSDDVDLTNSGADSGSTGKVGDCYRFIFANSDYMYHPTFLDVIPVSDKLTFETWAYHESDTADFQHYFSKQNIPSQDRFRLGRITTDDFLQLYVEGTNDGDTATDTVATIDNDWTYQVGKYDGTNNLRIYRNTVETIGGNSLGLLRDGTDTHFYIGCWVTAAAYMDGYLDEFRVSDIVRNDSWIKACFHTQNQSSHLGDFLSWGSEQTEPPGANPPIVSNEYPADGSVYVCPNSVELGITVSDPDGDLMNITFWSNLSGVWDYFYTGTINATLVNVADGTYYINPIYFVQYNFVYYWNVSVTDGTDIVDSAVFSFTTSSSPCGKGGGGGMSGGSVMGIIGMVGIFGLLGFIMNRRRKKQ